MYVNRYYGSKARAPHYESAETSVISEEEASKEQILSRTSNNYILKACIKKSLSESCRARKRKARGMPILVFGYERLVSRFSMSCVKNLEKKKEEVVQA